MIGINNSRKMGSSDIQNKEGNIVTADPYEAANSPMSSSRHGTTGVNKEESNFAAEKNLVVNSSPTSEPFDVEKAAEINVGQAK